MMPKPQVAYRFVGAFFFLASSAVLHAEPRSPVPAPGPLDVELDELSPGLLAVYRSSVDKNAVIARVDAKPAFTLGHSSPHPRLPPAPFEVTWNGVLVLKDKSPISFDAYLGGELTMEVDGVTVLQGRGDNDTTLLGPKEVLHRPTGFYRLKIAYRSRAGIPARLQIGWQGPTFSREPLPAWQLKHRAKELSEAMRSERLAEQGRIAVGGLGCARCHRNAFPGITDAPPGPSLADVGHRISSTWLMHWLDNPVKIRSEARMPALFAADRNGFVERWLIADYLAKPPGEGKHSDAPQRGDHRLGRQTFIRLGCAACHFLPDTARTSQTDLDRVPFVGLGDRFGREDLATFLGNPRGRYPDGRMPCLPVPPDAALDIAAFLLMWSKPIESPHPPAPTAEEIQSVLRRLGVRNRNAAVMAIIRQKRCAECHPGLGAGIPDDVPLTANKDARGCLSDQTLPRFTIDSTTRKAIAAYRTVANRERHPSPFEARQRQLERAGCLRCHQRDTDRAPPIEQVGSTLGGGFLAEVPFQRTPRLTYPNQKYTRAHLLAAVREGISGLRPASYSYRMPAFGHDAEALVQALAEGDGELTVGSDPPARTPIDPTAASLEGPTLVGFQGYACVACHAWNGKLLSPADPGAVGPELIRVAGRIRRDWFDRFLDDPARSHPGTPMPSIFVRGQPATLNTILDGDAVRQKDALWNYFALGKDAPSPKPPPPLPVTPPAAGEPPLIAQIPIRLPDGRIVESICLLSDQHDLVIYDLGIGAPHSLFTGGQIVRHVQGRLRSYSAAGTYLKPALASKTPLHVSDGSKRESPTAWTLHGYDRLRNAARIRARADFPSTPIEMVETIQMPGGKAERQLVREVRFSGIPAGRTITIQCGVPQSVSVHVTASAGTVKATSAAGIATTLLMPNDKGEAAARIHYCLPAAQEAPAVVRLPVTDSGDIGGTRERPGYRAIAYPRPKTSSGDDLIMPAALAVHPRDGRLFIASMKMGEIFVLREPAADGKKARFDNYARGLFQEAFGLLAEYDSLYVLHRRNLTRIVESKHDGIADRFDRVAALPHGIADTYDYGYGLVRDRTGAFVFSYAPYANRHLPGSGGAVRLVAGEKLKEIAFGFRNPFGWCSGPDREVFFTDNQGEWVATNKLCHLQEGRFYGFPNPEQKQHTSKPVAKAAVWIPYSWARSINGVAYDNTAGKFGPFAGQHFLAELMYGGALIRANVEKVNGEYQGACFPFWGKGLLGPLSLAFDPRGHLYVGSITEPGWMAQPDRGALFRIDFTGQTPFEMQSIHIRPRGFRVVFTAPVSPESVRIPSFQIEQYQYEYTGAYGSPELDRARVRVERVTLSADGRSVELTTDALVKDRVYLISAPGVRSLQKEPLVYPTGAYTVNEIPAGKK
jgi:cbb3-type cytochrome oxidase cytochrome c subunit/glucose/arabinose dehydrogenase/cytochrome c551/c552